MSKGKIPIKAAERISDQYNCPMVIIFAITQDGENFNLTTYGATKALCRHAADIGNKISEAIMNSKIEPSEKEPLDMPDVPMIYESSKK